MDNFDSKQSSSTTKSGSQYSNHKLSRPSSKSSGLSQVVVSQMQPKVSDPSEEDTTSQTSYAKGAPSSQTSPELSSAKISNASEPKAAVPASAHPPPQEASMQLPPYQPPDTTTPVISPPQSPNLYQQPMYGGQPAPYPYGYPPHPNMPGRFYGGTFSPSSREFPRSPSVVSKQEHQQILEKVTNVLPDINRLLEHYQETQGQLSAKDIMVKQSELMRAEEIARLLLELDAKKEESDKLIERLVGENYKYKLEIEEKNTTIATLENAAKDYPASKDFGAMKTRHDEAVSAADAARLAKEDLLAEKLRLESSHMAKYDQHRRDIEDLEHRHESALEAKQKDHSKAASEHKLVLSKVQLELANLITKHSSVKKEFEASRGTILALEQQNDTAGKDHEAALNTHQSELESNAMLLKELQDQHRQQLQSQLDSITSSRQQEIQALQEAHDQKLKDMMSDHESNATKLAEEHDSQMTAIRGELDDRKRAFYKLQTDHAEIGTKHTELSGALFNWKRRQGEWKAENDRFNKLLETLGHAGDSKPDGI